MLAWCWIGILHFHPEEYLVRGSKSKRVRARLNYPVLRVEFYPGTLAADLRWWLSSDSVRVKVTVALRQQR